MWLEYLQKRQSKTKKKKHIRLKDKRHQAKAVITKR
jgi:hypothetical protein